MDLILPLSTASRLPTPVLKPTLPRDDSATAEQPQPLQQAPPPEPVTAPYQALPVTGSTIISHNFTPALPVLDADELDKEVRAAAALAVRFMNDHRVGAAAIGVCTARPRSTHSRRAHRFWPPSREQQRQALLLLKNGYHSQPANTSCCPLCWIGEMTQGDAHGQAW